MEIPKFSIYQDSFKNRYNVHIYDDGLRPILPLVKEHMEESLFIGMIMNNDTTNLVHQKVNSFLFNLAEQNYIFKFPQNKWQVNIVEIISNKLGYSIRGGKCIPLTNSEDPTNNYQVLADCLVDYNRELYSQVKLQPAEIIHWLTEELDQPKLYEAVEQLKNEMILEIANIK